jgi:hypothetical protein
MWLLELRRVNLIRRGYQPTNPRTSIVADVIIGRSPIKTSLTAHPICNGVIRTGRIAGYTKTADYLTPLVQSNAAAEGYDATDRKPIAGSLAIEERIKRFELFNP